MRACRLAIKNFRGIKSATVLLPAHGVLIGDNNTGKTSILEALDLVLGPDRLNRQPPIDEHDFFLAQYLTGAAPAGDGAAGDPLAAEPDASEAPKIEIEVTVADLTEEQKARFGDYTEFWNSRQVLHRGQPGWSRCRRHHGGVAHHLPRLVRRGRG